MLDAVDVYILIDDFYLCAIYSSSVWLDPILEIAAFGFSKIVTHKYSVVGKGIRETGMRGSLTNGPHMSWRNIRALIRG